MARNASTSKNLDSDMARELEEALDIDLNMDELDELDIAASMHDLEEQISKAADELVREGRGTVETAPLAEAAQKRTEKTAAANHSQSELRPVEPICPTAAPLPPAANDVARRASQRAPVAEPPGRARPTGWSRCFRWPGSAAASCWPTCSMVRASGKSAASTSCWTRLTRSCSRSAFSCPSCCSGASR